MDVLRLQTGNSHGLRAMFRQRLAPLDRTAWRRFLITLLALTLALFLALYATAMRESGRAVLGAVFAVMSLVVAGLVAVKAIPYLARRTALRRWRMKVEYEFTGECAVYLAVVVVIMIAALNTGNNLLFMVLSCLLAGILASGLLSAFMLAGLELEFTLPDHVFAGRPTMTRLRLENRKRFFASFSLTIDAPTRRRAKPSEQDLTPKPAILREPVYIPYIPRHSSVDRSLEMVFPRRGRYSQEGLRVSTKFPFGFLRKAHTVPLRQEMLVLPKVEPAEEFYEILPNIGSEMASYLKGLGHDLYAIRDFQQTDTGRHIDWKATAKAQQLKVREFTREDERRVGLVFDLRLPNAQAPARDKFEKAIAFCACLAWHFYKVGTMLQFVTEGFEIPMLPAEEVIYPILEKLALIEPTLGGTAVTQKFLADTLAGSEGFQIVITCQPRGSIPTRQWESSYFLFMDSL